MLLQLLIGSLDWTQKIETTSSRKTIDIINSVQAIKNVPVKMETFRQNESTPLANNISAKGPGPDRKPPGSGFGPLHI